MPGPIENAIRLEVAQRHQSGESLRSISAEMHLSYETVQNWRDYWPAQLPMPHPSPRNKLWLIRNPWFEEDVIPVLRQHSVSLMA